jgi:hypothetical protein
MFSCCAVAAFFIESGEGNELWWRLNWIESLPISKKLDCAAIGQPIGKLRLDFSGRAIHSCSIESVSGIVIPNTVGTFASDTIYISVGDTNGMPIGETILVSIGEAISIPVGEAISMPIGEAISVPIDGLRFIHDLGIVPVHEAKICAGWRQRSCVMVRRQPSFLEIVISVIDNDMSVRTADSKGVYRDPAKAVRGPRCWFQRELKSPFRCWDLWVDFLKVDVWRDESILKDKNGLDDADCC